jgi:hypothetical protein
MVQLAYLVKEQQQQAQAHSIISTGNKIKKCKETNSN